MTRTRIILLNVVCWILGVLCLWLGNLVLVHLIPVGIIRTILYFLLLGLVVTVFGGSYGMLTGRGGGRTSGL